MLSAFPVSHNENVLKYTKKDDWIECADIRIAFTPIASLTVNILKLTCLASLTEQLILR